MPNLSWKKIILIVIKKFFESDIINAAINIILPCVISVHCTKYTNDFNWWLFTIIMFAIIIVFNIMAAIFKRIKDKQQRQLNIVFDCYCEHGVINSKFATSIFRLNKSVNQHLIEKKPISKNLLDKIADFQSFSFSICESIQKMMVKEFGSDILCEVTLMKKENDKIKMVAYANNDDRMPSSYKNEFKLDSSSIFFIRVFNDLNGEICCLPTKEDISDNFHKLEGSAKREDEICQYIGIPIKTDRNEIELLLQVDVSKPKIFGKNKKEMYSFAKNILYPYAMLLYKSYERDLVFNQYYDMLTTVLSNSADQS